MKRMSDKASARVAWVVPVGLALSIVAWGALIRAAVPDRPRGWSYGTLPYVPADTAYSTERPAVGKAPRQIEPPPPPPEVTR
ncbi:MAG TPA: hypothetical protein VGN26_15090 [Armatimonadota bacterium]|jgi:hypothetical protein